jgi:hypothetical protein
MDGNQKIEWAEGMRILRASRVYSPAIVIQGGQYHVFSRTALLSSGPTLAQALQNGGFLPPPPDAPMLYVAVGANVVQGNDPICVARSKTAAARIANALNEYVPGDRGF